MPRPVKFLLAVLLSGLAGFALLRWLLIPLASPEPDNLGVQNGRLAPCPDSPNCVSTQAEHSLHRIDPIPYEGETAVVHQDLLRILHEMPRSTIRYTDPTYIHAEFRSPTWGFVDDVEFYFDEANQLIHFRSAARLGEGDMGINRARMEEIREFMRNN
ncbi:MAG: DUF1499 domain-containing protein [Chloroflexota bacterium]